MNEKTYSILRQDRRMKGFIYEVFVDDLAGFDEFTFDQAEHILPGSTVDIADLKRVFRLRNDREWEEYQNYSDSDDPAAEEEAAAASILDELISDDDIADLITEDASDNTGEATEGAVYGTTEDSTGNVTEETSGETAGETNTESEEGTE